MLLQVPEAADLDIGTEWCQFGFLTMSLPISFPPTATFFARRELRTSNPSASIQMGRVERLGISATFREAQNQLEDRKYQLLRLVQDTQRGLVTTTEQRSSIEEALVSVEAFDAGDPIDLAELHGTWRLQYASAPDVLILLDSATRLPFFQIGQIFQKFECREECSGGVVSNVVRWSIPNLLEEHEGATLLVSAKFSVISLRNIYLQFGEIAIENIMISDGLQALIAPALLSRSSISLQVLQFIRSLKAQIPVRSRGRNPVGGLYYLSYLDGNMLLGRSVGSGGVFVFTRAQALT